MDYLIKNCNILDVIKGKLQNQKSVRIENGIIKYIVPAELTQKISTNAKIINADGMTLLPGLIDAHIHACWSFFHDKTKLLNSPFKYAMDVKESLKRNLMAGFTTIRDAGGATLEIKEMIKNGELEGPDIYTCGSPISQTCGHGDFIDPITQHQYSASLEPLEIADGIEECLKAVRRQFKKNVDWIKVFAGGGLASPFDPIDSCQFMKSELKAIVDAAHDYNKKVFAHAHSVDVMKRSIECGVDCIEHATCATKEVFEFAIENNIMFVPTVGVFFEDDFGDKQEFADKLRESLFKMLDLSKKYFDSMLIGSGSDIFMYDRHGKGANELAYRVKCGWSEMMAIKSATYINAKILGIENEIGVIKEGYKADLLLVKGNPLKDISVLTESSALKLIIKGGLAVKNIC